MATTTTQPVQIEAARSANPIVLWHLLSLDAPTVASLWTWFIAHASGIRLPWTTAAAMFLAVWTLYAADRLLDARPLSDRMDVSIRAGGLNSTSSLELRHIFHHDHRTRFLAFIAGAAILLTGLIPHLNTNALRLFAIEGAVLALWFTTLHATTLARHLPKELALGPFFSAATYIPTLARASGSRWHLLPGAVLFALLCSLNCLFIHRWESTPLSSASHASTRWAARHTTLTAAILILAGAALALALHSHRAAVPAGIVLAAAMLLVLDWRRASFRRTTLRAAADAALLTPLLVLLLTRCLAAR